nr:hypothetical protein Iba_chr01aCG3750 [Ipomoea batatas]
MRRASVRGVALALRGVRLRFSGFCKAPSSQISICSLHDDDLLGYTLSDLLKHLAIAQLVFFIFFCSMYDRSSTDQAKASAEFLATFCLCSTVQVHSSSSSGRLTNGVCEEGAAFGEEVVGGVRFAAVERMFLV